MVKVSSAFSDGGNSTGINDDTQNRYELQNETYMTFGKHSLKYGGRLRATTDGNSTNANFNSEYSFGKRQLPGCVPTTVDNCQITPLEAYQITLKGQAAGLPFSAIQAMGGGASFYTLAVNPAGRAATDVTYVDGALFVQDDWKIRLEHHAERRVAVRDAKQSWRSCRFRSAVGAGVGYRRKGKSGSPKMVLRAGSGFSTTALRKI